MMKLLKNNKQSLGYRKRLGRVAAAAASILLTGAMVTVYHLMPVMGAAVDVLNGNGSMDDAAQVGAWNLTNVTGTSNWTLDTSGYYVGPGSGELESPSGSNVSYEAYVSYSFSTDKLPVSASLNLAYTKQYLNIQPAAGQWDVQAEIWQVGGSSPLQVIPIDTGNVNIGWTNLTDLDVTAVSQINTQYELRLVQKGTTGADMSAFSTTWFDNVQLNVNYDSTPPEVVSASAPNDSSVEVVFSEAVDQASAQNIANYAISPELQVTDAVLLPDGKTVRLTTATQTYGANYTVTVNNIADISGNIMTVSGAAAFTGQDSTPPIVVSAVPVTDHTVNIKFSEPVDLSTAQNIANYSISPSLNINAAVLQADLQTVQLTTDVQDVGTNYTVTVNNVQDAHGNQISTNNSDVFIGIDTTPPTLISAASVNDTAINLIFSEPVDPATAQNSGNYSISPELVVTSAALQADQKTVLLTTASKQTIDTSYTATVTGVTDIHGNAVNDSNTAVFTGSDTTPPQVASAIPVDDTTVNVIFNEPVDAVSAQTAANYTLDPNLAVAGAVLQADQMIVQLTTDRQTWETDYTITASNISDLAGNQIAGNNSASFTGLDNTTPTVVSASSIDDTTVDVVFSEVMDASTAQTSANYAISGGLESSNPVLQSDGKTVRLTTAKQTYQTAYTVTVTGVLDLVGNPIGSTGNSASFNGIDSTPAKVEFSSNINYNTVNLVFSETIEQTTAETISNYSMSPDLQITAALLQSDGVTVQLTTSSQTGGTEYSVKVVNVSDLSGNIIGKYGGAAKFYGITPPNSGNPMVLSAGAPDNNTVEIEFNATLDPVTAQTESNYSISPDLPVTGALLMGDGVSVRLTTVTQTSGTAYTVTVFNVQDIYGTIVDISGNTATFSGSGISTDNPHGSYLDNTNQCSNCHVTHNAQGPGLLNMPSQTEACYLCHDAGGQSQYDVAGEFGKTAPYANSHHGIPEGTQQCSDCHDPHDGRQDEQSRSVHWPRLLQSSASLNTHSGNDFCFSCHKDPQGDTKIIDPSTYPAAGVGHNDTDFTINGITPFKPDSGTGISCIACHSEHGSSLDKLVQVNPTNDVTNVTAKNKSLCYKCHTEASANGRYAGKTVYENTAVNPHALTASTKTNVDYPGVTGQAGQCASCHDPHGSANGTAQVSMKTLRGIYNDGKTSYTAEDFALCFGCHNSTSKDGNYDIQTPYNDTQGGHIIKTAGGNLEVGSKMPCESCHTQHGSANNNKYMLKDSLGSNLGDGRNECLACHQAGKQVEGLTMSALSSGVTEHSGGTMACLTCHDSSHAPTQGVSAGGQDCSTCHSTTALALSSGDSGYHHMVSDTAATYSTTQNGALNCLSCHVDHNKFNKQKAFNLKSNFSESFPTDDTTPGQNTDFNASDTIYGGLCLSCHKNQQTKNYSRANGSLATPPISISGYGDSAHNYNVFSVFSDSSVFNANCVKCHNDDMSKTQQTSTYRFGNHNSDYQSILSPFEDWSLNDPLKQQFCLKCHNTSGEFYGTAMSDPAKLVEDQFGKASKHDITGADGAQLTCVNCHDPHSVSKNPLSAGLDNSNISDPANTLNPFTQAAGDLSAFCLKCHNGSPPVAVNDGSAFVPYSVIFPDSNFTSTSGGWNKNTYNGSGHYSAGYQCDKCHANHGSDYSRLTLLPEDSSATPSATSGICLQCHGNQPNRPAGAADVYTDLTSGSDFTYRHPTLDVTGKHSDTETYPQAAADRDASCNDCHDSHAANSTTASGGNASGKIAGTTGVTPAYPTTNSPFAAPSSYSFGEVSKEYQLCFKCHTGFNGNFPEPPAGAIAETDLATEFNPSNPSFHDVGLYTGSARSYVASFQTGTNLAGSTVLYCSSCHGPNTTGNLSATSGPVHGSSNQYILKGVWTSSTNSSTQDNLCLKCHSLSGTSRFIDSTGTNLHNGLHQGISCQSCHSEVPHGGKRPSLISITPSSPITGTYGYDEFYDGLYGKNSKLSLQAWKSGGVYWNKSDCGGCHT